MQHWNMQSAWLSQVPQPTLLSEALYAIMAVYYKPKEGAFFSDLEQVDLTKCMRKGIPTDAIFLNMNFS